MNAMTWPRRSEAVLHLQSKMLSRGQPHTQRISLVARSLVAVSGRVEYTVDEDQVVLGTGSVGSGPTAVANPPFSAVGGSLGIDVQPESRLLWRTEVRGWRNEDAIFPDGRNRLPTRTSAFVVSSLALTF